MACMYLTSACLSTEGSDYSDTNPLVVKISQEDEQPIRLPDFGGHSPIRKEEEERRPHGRI